MADCGRPRKTLSCRSFPFGGLGNRRREMENFNDYAQAVLGMIGNMPVATVEGITVKLEYFNPSGSVKDRFVMRYLEKLYREGKLKKGGNVAEATTGNTGISAAMWCALRGVNFTAFLPSNASQERLKIITGMGAKTVVAHSVLDAVQAKDGFLRANPDAVPVDQFANPDNPLMMQKLGEELLEFEPEVFVAGQGTGGTVIGVARVLGERLGTHIVAVEPEESPMLTKGRCAQHPIEGIGEDFVPEIIARERDRIGEVAVVSGAEALVKMKELWKLGFFVGVSSAANLLVAQRYAAQGKRVATLFPDNGYRYFFTR